jgi:DNA ligase-1
MVFDAPKINKNFKKRQEILKQELKNSPNFIEILDQIPCKSQKHLDDLASDIFKKGGEGLMIKDPKSFYENKRSDKLLKIKKFTDAEAKVIGHEKGTGRCS